MKKASTTQREVAAILDTAVNKDGERMFRVKWMDTWEYEESLKDYKCKIQQYWSKYGKNLDALHSPSFNPVEKPSPKHSFIVENKVNEGNAIMKKTDDIPNRVTKNTLKRRPTLKLENIVSKLKKSRHEGCLECNNNRICNNNKNISKQEERSTNRKIWSPFINETLLSSIDKSPQQAKYHSREAQQSYNGDAYRIHDGDKYHRNNYFKEHGTERNLPDINKFNKKEEEEKTIYHYKHETLCFDACKGKRRNPNEILSGVNQEKYEENEKSSFVVQLEEKDYMSDYMNTLTMVSTSYYKQNEVSISKTTNQDGNSSSGESSQNETNDFSDNSLENTMSSTNKQNKTENLASDKISETKCEKCNKRFYRRSQLLRHLSNHVVHECHKCNAVFYCVRKFKRHLTTHESFPCEFCDEEFYDASAWYQHRAKHIMVKCSSCEMVFYNKTSLLKHRISHSEYICPVCHHGFKDMNFWLPHRAYHGRVYGNTITSPLLRCTECQRTFPTQDVYLKHKCIHSTKGRTLERKIRSPFSKQDISDLIGVDQTGFRA